MKSLRILFVDELVGFSRSKVMLVLWVGLPLLSVAFRYFRPNTEDIPLLTLVAILLASIGGTVAAVLLSTGITAERRNGVYELFLVRPVRRIDLLLAKFFAAFSSLLVAVLLSVLLGFAIEAASGTHSVVSTLRQNIESLSITIAGISVACSVGVLFGVLLSSVAVSAILAAYLGNQITGALILPVALSASINIVIYCLLVGILVPGIVLYIAGIVFNRRRA